MKTISKHQRSKSQSPHDTSFPSLKHPQLKNTKKVNDIDPKRCYCCHGQSRYPDYLAELRKERLEKLQKKMISEAFMESPIPLVQSKQVNEEVITEFVAEDNNFISRMSNKVSEYEQTPRKSLLQQFHESIIRSHSKNSHQGSLKHQDSKQTQGSSFLFEISVEDVQTGEIFLRKFTAPEYGKKAVQIIEDIFLSSC